MSSVEPGWYAAQGDPPGTQRYWDGSQWVGEPQPIGGAQVAATPLSGQYGTSGQFGAQADYATGADSATGANYATGADYATSATGASFGVDSPPASFGSEANLASAVPQPKSETPFGWFLLYWSRWNDFKGRGRRAEYWWGGLITSFFSLVALIAVLLIAVVLGAEFLIIPAFLVMWLVLIVPSLSAAFRRLHDTGKSGWFLLLGFIPLVSLVLLYFYLLDSDRGANQYGMSPKSMFNNR